MQSRSLSFVESIANIVIGFVVAIATQSVVFPGFGLAPTANENAMIGLIFASVSFARGYAIRRLFVWLDRKA